MAELLHLIAGSEVRCTDGRVGHVRGLIFDPRARAITHLSVDASSLVDNGRIVPMDNVRSASPVMQLGCTRNDYHRFPENEELDVATGGASYSAAVLHVHLVPHGETEIKKHENVHAVDGRAGHLIGAAVDRDTHAVQELLVQVGHFSDRHQIAVPVDAVTAIDAHGIHLHLSKDEVSHADPR